MRGTVSFHPVATAFFDDLLQPLVAGRKVNPEAYLDQAIRIQSAAWSCAPYLRSLEQHLDLLPPPPVPTEGKLWERVRARLELLDYRPHPTSVLVARHIERDLHLRGRPFLITEGSADRVTATVDEYCDTAVNAETQALALAQLARLNPELRSKIEPEPMRSAAALTLRRGLLDELKGLYDLAQAARNGDKWSVAGGLREPAAGVLERELPWRALVLQSRALPFWIADDVDGLETVCNAAGVPVPACITPAYRLFGDLDEACPGLARSLGTELTGERGIGAWVAPGDMSELLEFLNRCGSAIIKAASGTGNGVACATLLRKIRECAKYAETHDLGYLEASGVPPLGPNPDVD